jgi:hypothetical protein
MGYPNKRVSMTDVHGEPQQGGYLPAEIWHDYMSTVTEGQPCVPFGEAKEPISYQPFFGHYASTGRTTQSNEYSQENLGPQEKKLGEKVKLPNTNSPGQGGGTGGGGNKGAGNGAGGGGGAGGGDGTGAGNGGGAAGTGAGGGANPATPAPNANAPSEPTTAAPGGGAANGNGGNTGGAGAGQ